MSFLLIAMLRSTEYILEGKGVLEAENLIRKHEKEQVEKLEGGTIEGFILKNKATGAVVLKDFMLIVTVVNSARLVRRNVKDIPVLPEGIEDDTEYRIAAVLMKEKIGKIVDELYFSNSFLSVGANYKYICDLTAKENGMQVWSSGALGLWVGQSNYYKTSY